MFPDTDPVNRGRDSMDMLSRAVAKIGERAMTVVNVDVTVVAEHPRLGPHREKMCLALADALSIPVDRVSIKGKTNEGMGWIGRGEGIACIAVATVTTEAEARS